MNDHGHFNKVTDITAGARWRWGDGIRHRAWRNVTMGGVVALGIAMMASGCGSKDDATAAGAPRAARQGEIQLSKPEFEKIPFLKIVQKRKTTRAFNPKALPENIVSNILYAAFGINRPESEKRTAPTAHNGQYVDIYVATSDGVYVFDAQKPSLVPILGTDERSKTGIQEFAATAPLSLVYVVDNEKVIDAPDDETKLIFGAVSVGAIAENVYLYAAATGLVTGVRADIEHKPLRDILKLKKSQKIILAQSVGYAE